MCRQVGACPAVAHCGSRDTSPAVRAEEHRMPALPIVRGSREARWRAVRSPDPGHCPGADSGLIDQQDEGGVRAGTGEGRQPRPQGRAHTLRPCRVLRQYAVRQICPPPYCRCGSAQHHVHRPAATLPQYPHRMVDQRPAAVLEQRLRPTAQPPSAAGGEQQPRHHRRPSGRPRRLGFPFRLGFPRCIPHLAWIPHGHRNAGMNSVCGVAGTVCSGVNLRPAVSDRCQTGVEPWAEKNQHSVVRGRELCCQACGRGV